MHSRPSHTERTACVLAPLAHHPPSFRRHLPLMRRFGTSFASCQCCSSNPSRKRRKLRQIDPNTTATGWTGWAGSFGNPSSVQCREGPAPILLLQGIQPDAAFDSVIWRPDRRVNRGACHLAAKAVSVRAYVKELLRECYTQAKGSVCVLYILMTYRDGLRHHTTFFPLGWSAVQA